MAISTRQDQTDRDDRLADLEARLAAALAQRDEAIAQQHATTEILSLINASPGELAPVFDAILEKAHRLCGAPCGSLQLYEHGYVRPVAIRGMTAAFDNYLRQGYRLDDQYALVNLSPVPVQQLDLAEVLKEFPDVAAIRAAVELGGIRTFLSIPLVKDTEVLGRIVAGRQEVLPFTDRQIALLQGFAAQAVIAIENARLLGAQQAALDRQTATAEILSAIANSPGDADQSLHRIAEITARLFGASSTSVLIADGEKWGRTLRVGAGSQRIGSAIPIAHVAITPQFMPGAVYLENRQVHVPDIDDPEAMARWPGIAPARAAGSRSMSGTPLRREGKAIGAMIVHRDRLAPFTDDELALLQSFADQAAIATENARLINETREALERQTATAEILKVIASSPSDVQPVFDAIAQRSKRLVDALSTTVFRLIDGMMHLKAYTPVSPEADAALNAMFPAPLSSMSWGDAIAKGGIFRVIDTENEIDQLRELARLRGFRSMLFVPLLRDGAPIGVIAVTRVAPGPFDDHHVALLQTFADQAVIAIRNVQMFDEVQARTRDLQELLQQQTATADVLKVISRSAFDLQKVLETLARSAVELSGARRAAIFLRDGDVFRFQATSYTDAHPEWVQHLRDHPQTPGRKSAIARSIASAQVVCVPDVLEDPEIELRANQLAGIRAVLAVPLLRDGKVEGVMALSRPTPGPFNDRQIALVQTFADQAVIAIENARLFDEVQARTKDLQESLQQQTATADVLKVISRSAFDLQAVFDTLINSAVELSGALNGTICLRDGDGFRYAAASATMNSDFAQWLIDHPPKPDRASGAGRVLMSGKVEIITDVLEDPDYTIPASTLNKTRALLGVPLLGKDRIEGALVLSRTEPGHYTQRQIELVQSFADQAVIAIENVRLFDEVQARTRDLSEALQQQTATADVLKVISRSAFDLQAVFDTLLSSAVTLIGAVGGTICVRDGEVFPYRAISGTTTPELRQFLATHPATPGRHLVAGRVLLAGEVVVIPDITLDRELTMPRTDVRAYLGVPLLRDDRVEGALVLVREAPGDFDRRQIELVQSFADQAVIAIENVRLFDEVQARTRELATSLEELRATQDRLVQTEKLASLGQLTAGIAHEIKNPLNFVNNFSALSSELIDELNEVLAAAPLDGAMRGDVDELTHLLKGNLEKVVQHGQRADSIVKNMLLHSREGAGEHRPADINALIEESLNLAYHGARAEKPGFNITLQRDFDAAAGEIMVFPQEITRVFLNLISNGFYATAKRKAAEGPGFEPMLIATTRRLDDAVEVRIRDNGTGIPPEVRNKMFNPFFTTKPAGEGTGLGLSMSHDIVVKQHGGLIAVETEPGSFTEFIITLPRASRAADQGG